MRRVQLTGTHTVQWRKSDPLIPKPNLPPGQEQDPASLEPCWVTRPALRAGVGRRLTGEWPAAASASVSTGGPRVPGPASPCRQVSSAIHKRDRRNPGAPGRETGTARPFRHIKCKCASSHSLLKTRSWLHTALRIKFRIRPWLFTGVSKLWPVGCIQQAAYFCKLSFIGIPLHSFMYVPPITAFTPQQQSRVVTVETGWPTQPEIFTIGPFTEKVCRPTPSGSCTVRSHLQGYYVTQSQGSCTVIIHANGLLWSCAVRSLLSCTWQSCLLTTPGSSRALQTFHNRGSWLGRV